MQPLILITLMRLLSLGNAREWTVNSLCFVYLTVCFQILSFGCINSINSRDTVILVIYFVRKNSFILNMFEIIKY